MVAAALALGKTLPELASEADLVQAKFLNYDLAPKPVIVFSCLLPAPFISAVVGLLFMLADHSTLPSRFAPLVLSVTHGLVLAGLMPVMLGALFQLFPVVAGQNIAAARYLSPLIAPGCSSIALLLSWGFYGHSSAFSYAALIAAVLFAAIITALIIAGWRIQVVDATTRMLAYSGWALAAVILSALILLAILSGDLQFDLYYVLRLHQTAGLLGWILALILSVASTVFPMFWQSPRPSPRWQASMPQLLWLVLLSAGLSSVIPSIYCDSLITLSLFVIALVSLRWVWQAKRRFDAAWPLWLAASLSLLSAICLFVLEQIAHYFAWPIAYALSENLPWWLGVLLIVGLAYSCVIAMLGKIIPFLVFLHLRKQIAPPQPVPTMQQVLPPRYLNYLSYSHILSLLILLARPFELPHIARLGAAVFCAAQLLLTMLLLNCLWRYRQTLRQAFAVSKYSAEN